MKAEEDDLEAQAEGFTAFFAVEDSTLSGRCGPPAEYMPPGGHYSIDLVLRFREQNHWMKGKILARFLQSLDLDPEDLTHCGFRMVPATDWKQDEPLNAEIGLDRFYGHLCVPHVFFDRMWSLILSASPKPHGALWIEERQSGDGWGVKEIKLYTRSEKDQAWHARFRPTRGQRFRRAFTGEMGVESEPREEERKPPWSSPWMNRLFRLIGFLLGLPVAHWLFHAYFGAPWWVVLVAMLLFGVAGMRIFGRNVWAPQWKQVAGAWLGISVAAWFFGSYLGAPDWVMGAAVVLAAAAGLHLLVGDG